MFWHKHKITKMNEKIRDINVNGKYISLFDNENEPIRVYYSDELPKDYQDVPEVSYTENIKSPALSPIKDFVKIPLDKQQNNEKQYKMQYHAMNNPFKRKLRKSQNQKLNSKSQKVKLPSASRRTNSANTRRNSPNNVQQPSDTDMGLFHRFKLYGNPRAFQSTMASQQNHASSHSRSLRQPQNSRIT
jgi:hypothetical protein